ncbi:MAG: hydrogenase formation protein HypD, partial [Dehalococcoidia bacterium]
MKYIDEYRDAELGRQLIARIEQRSSKLACIMEFCGGHTVSIARYGIRQLLPPTIEMLSGPGCPVCVTANTDLDKAVAMASLPDVIITTFGDMIKVPASRSSLQHVKAEGGDVRIVYSTQDALEIAKENPSKSVIFIGIGFETTAPTVAASILQAEQQGINNYYVLSQHKLCPPVMKALLDFGDVKLNGIICPGHVSAIIGSRPYEFIPRDYGIACVVSGFEPLDILLCVDMLIGQIENGEPAAEIAYRRGVRPEGNKVALELLYKVFDICDANWRGIGTVSGSGLKIRKEYQRYDAEYAFPIEPGEPIEPKGCICGDILRGLSNPLDCTLFRNICNPEHPIGPCMVSSEGSCA